MVGCWPLCTSTTTRRRLRPRPRANVTSVLILTARKTSTLPKGGTPRLPHSIGHSSPVAPWSPVTAYSRAAVRALNTLKVHATHLQPSSRNPPLLLLATMTNVSQYNGQFFRATSPSEHVLLLEMNR